MVYDSSKTGKRRVREQELGFILGQGQNLLKPVLHPRESCVGLWPGKATAEHWTGTLSSPQPGHCWQGGRLKTRVTQAREQSRPLKLPRPCHGSGSQCFSVIRGASWAPGIRIPFLPASQVSTSPCPCPMRKLTIDSAAGSPTLVPPRNLWPTSKSKLQLHRWRQS